MTRRQAVTGGCRPRRMPRSICHERRESLVPQLDGNGRQLRAQTPGKAPRLQRLSRITLESRRQSDNHMHHVEPCYKVSNRSHSIGCCCPIDDVVRRSQQAAGIGHRDARSNRAEIEGEHASGEFFSLSIHA